MRFPTAVCGGDAKIEQRGATPEVQPSIVRVGRRQDASRVHTQAQDGGRAVVRDFAGGQRINGREAAAFEKTPCLAVLGTQRDGRVDWLHVGQALERVLLQATLDGLATSLSSHALEWPELGGLYATRFRPWVTHRCCCASVTGPLPRRPPEGR